NPGRQHYEQTANHSHHDTPPDEPGKGHPRRTPRSDACIARTRNCVIADLCGTIARINGWDAVSTQPQPFDKAKPARWLRHSWPIRTPVRKTSRPPTTT